VAAARLAAVHAALGAGVLAALLAGALAWWLVRPIAVLQRCAQRLLAGSEAGRWPGGGGEVGAVARSFQSLLAQRQEQQEAQRNLVAQLEAVLDNAEIGIALSRDSRFVMVSSRFCQIVRNERAAIVGQATRMIHADEAAYQAFSERAHPAFMAHGVFEGEVELVRRDGERFWARMRGRAVVPGDRAHGTIWVVDDITDVRRQREQLAWAASHDALTGLVNRAAFEVRLEEHNAHAAARPFCALFIDLDRFKPVNDGAGHAAGDALLRGVAAALRETVRQSDTVARLGGDEFGVLLPDCPLPRAHALAEQLRAAVESYELLWEERRLSVGASVGLVLCNGAHPSAIDVLREADTACYQAKRAGRGQVAVASGPLR
jgi:diguanylate cyclase (GGDEF)-like protein/PAS domain S-box-containing protein